MKAPVARRTPPSRKAKASAAAVRPGTTPRSDRVNEGGPSPVIVAAASPAVPFSVLLFSPVLSMATPRPRVASPRRRPRSPGWSPRPAPRRR